MVKAKIGLILVAVVLFGISQAVFVHQFPVRFEATDPSLSDASLIGKDRVYFMPLDGETFAGITLAGLTESGGLRCTSKDKAFLVGILGGAKEGAQTFNFNNVRFAFKNNNDVYLIDGGRHIYRNGYLYRLDDTRFKGLMTVINNLERGGEKSNKIAPVITTR